MMLFIQKRGGGRLLEARCLRQFPVCSSLNTRDFLNLGRLFIVLLAYV